VDRIYAVTDALAETQVLVKAASVAQAVGVVVSNRYSARAARPEDVLKALQGDGAVITKPQQQAPQP